MSEQWNGEERRSQPLHPDCYVRHAAMDNHINEGKFWRGTIIAFVLAFSGILVGQYNMSIQNNEKIISLTSKLSQIAESNIKRLDRMEDKIFYYVGERGSDGKTGATGAAGKDGKSYNQ